MFDIESIKNLEDTQKSNFYRAKVISLNDPLKINRIQVMIYGLTDDFENTDNVEDSPQPWCEFQFRDGVITYPNEGDIVWLFFEGGDIFRPVYLGTIYAGLDASTDEGFKRLLTQRSIPVSDVENYKTVMKKTNTENLIANDVHQGFTNIMLTEDDIPFQIFDGDNTAGEKVYGEQREGEKKSDDIKDGGEGGQTEEFQSYGINWGHYRYWPKIPKGWAGKPMYVWYYTEDITDEEAAAGVTWKDKCGGWTFYTAEQVQEGLASFPDNLRHFNYNRFQKWKKNVEGNRFDITKEKGKVAGWEESYSTVQQQWMWESNNPTNTIFGTPGASCPFLRQRPHRWEFLADYPWHFWQPEKTCDTGLWHSWIMSFPFGKMKIKNRKYWKQHTIMSHDSKSAIELDDNENYERLAMIFDHGSGGIEFSHAGMNGLDIWTDGIFHFQAGSQTNAGGPKEHSMWFKNGSFALSALASSFIGERKATVYATGSVELIGKLGTASIMANNGISLTSWGGLTALMGKDGSTERGQGLAQPVDTRGVWFGNPIISCPYGKKSAVGSGFQGFFLCLPTTGGDTSPGGMSDANAEQWIDKFNMFLLGMQQFLKVFSTDSPSLLIGSKAVALGITSLLDGWLTGASSGSVSGAKLGQAWNKIVVQGARS